MDPENTVTVAGLALIASDTGRVLMIQRALDPDDPAQGKWEFPGGHLNDGEAPVDAAVREWTEEVGMPLPASTAGGSWVATNGVYAGFVYAVASEDLVPTHEGREEAGDPDDPEADKIEAIAWWMPGDLLNNPSVRPELALDLALVHAALNWEPPEEEAPEDTEAEIPEEESMTAAGATTEVEPETNAPADEGVEADVDEVVRIPFHGVAAPTGVPSGDGRQFGEAGLTWRPLPLPFSYQRMTADGHLQSVVVGSIEEFHYEGNLLHYSGLYSATTPEVEQSINHIVEGTMRGVSVDVDDVELREYAEGEEDGGLMEFSRARVAGITQVNIPAFHEAYVALGPCDCTGDEEMAHDDDAAVAEEFAALIENAGTIDLTELSEEELFTFETIELADGFEAAISWLEANHPAALTASARSLIASGSFAPGTKDGPGWITHPIPTGRIRRYWTHGEGALKIRWGIPGDFNRCRKQLAKYITNPDWLAGACANMHKEATGVWPGQEGGSNLKRAALLAAGGVPAPMFSLVAAGTVPVRPASWFANPELEGPTRLTITPEGRIYGHLATWDSCHIGMNGLCTAPPRSASNYAYFYSGMMETDEGDIPVGHFTYGTGHAGQFQTMAQATAHYDQVDKIFCDVAIGDDGFGIWFAGALRTHVDDEMRRELKATGTISGDWREPRGGGELELVAGCSVGTEGFPVPQMSLAASGGHQVSLVASGVVLDSDVAAIDNTSPAAIALAAANIIEQRQLRRSRVAGARSSIASLSEELAPIAQADRQRRVQQARAQLEEVRDGVLVQ